LFQFNIGENNGFLKPLENNKRRLSKEGFENPGFIFCVKAEDRQINGFTKTTESLL